MVRLTTSLEKVFEVIKLLDDGSARTKGGDAIKLKEIFSKIANNKGENLDNYGFNFEVSITIKDGLVDVTVFDNSEEKEQAKVVANAFERSTYPMLLINEYGDVVCLNKKLRELLSLDFGPKLPKNLKWQDCFNLRQQKRLEYVLEKDRTIPETGVLVEMIFNCGIDECSMKIEKEYLEDGHILILFSDTSKVKKAKEATNYLKNHDSLTGLCNRTLFEESTKVMLKSPAFWPLTLILFDIDGLSKFNNMYSTEEGDLLLQRVAEHLQDSFSNGVLGRLGAGEFAVLLTRTTERKSYEAVKDFYLVFNKKLKELGYEVCVSYGLATKNDIDTSQNELYATAEGRLIRRKMLSSASNHSAYLTSLEEALRSRNAEDDSHSQRMRRLIVDFGYFIDLVPHQIDELELIAALHDLGKIGIPDSILNKKGPLTEAEWEIVKKHSEIGYYIASSIPELLPIAKAIYSHHEHWDGSGYPKGLKGKEIPFGSQVVAVIDAFDAMISNRPYRRQLSPEAALETIKQQRGKAFSPEVADNFIKMYVKGKRTS